MLRSFLSLRRVPMPARFFTTSSAAPHDEVTNKLKGVLEEYRQKNYGQTLFSRFIKEMVYAADANHDGQLSLSEAQQLLRNIGVSSEAVSSAELRNLFEHVGSQIGVKKDIGDSEQLYLDVDAVQELILGSKK